MPPGKDRDPSIHHGADLPPYLYLLSSGRVGTFGLAAFAVTTFMLSMIDAELVKALFPLAKHWPAW
jgi:hypothetical protein